MDAQDDQFTLFIDNGNHARQAQFFAINARGVLADGLFHAVDEKFDFVPDFQFGGAAQRDADGWTAELKFPCGNYAKACSSNHGQW